MTLAIYKMAKEGRGGGKEGGRKPYLNGKIVKIFQL